VIEENIMHHHDSNCPSWYLRFPKPYIPLVQGNVHFGPIITSFVEIALHE